MCRLNPGEKGKYIKIILSLLQSTSSAVVYECAVTLVGLSQAPTAIRAAANCYCQLLVSQSDNNVKLIVLDRLQVSLPGAPLCTASCSCNRLANAGAPAAAVLLHSVRNNIISQVVVMLLLAIGRATTVLICLHVGLFLIPQEHVYCKDGIAAMLDASPQPVCYGSCYVLTRHRLLFACCNSAFKAQYPLCKIPTAVLWLA